MNDCPNADVRDLLPDLVHDRLSPSVRAEVESHIATCADCQDEIALLRDLRASMRRTPTVDVSAVAAAVPAYRAPVRRRSWVGWQAAAAITILAAGGTSAIVLRSHPTFPIDSAAVVVASEREVSTPVAPPALQQAVPTAVSSISGGASRTASTAKPASPSAATVPSIQAPQPATLAPVVRERELAMAGGTMNELSDGELAKLLKDIDKMDAVPSTDVESGATTPRVPPRIAP